MGLLAQPLTVDEFYELPERRHEELEFGFIVREALPHTGRHDMQVGRLQAALTLHVCGRDLGLVLPGGGVVLDEEKALVVAPDVLVLLGERARNLTPDSRASGPPNLAIEVASPSTQRRDRMKKVPWYRTYGVEECWLVKTDTRTIEVFYLTDDTTEEGRTFGGDEILESRVLPDFRPPTSALFAPLDRKFLERFSYDKPKT